MWDQKILKLALNKIALVKTLKDLQAIKVEFLGKSSLVSQQIRKLSRLSLERRKELGNQINLIKKQISNAIEKKNSTLRKVKLYEDLSLKKMDLTIPGRPRNIGRIHPITQCIEELIQVFLQYGFDIKDGPSIENDWYNFTALNIEKNHPARQLHDTFYLNTDNGRKLLRTHTSTIQIRTMEKEDPPYRFIAPGRTYRSDSDLTHTPMFHQIEGLVVDKNIHMGHLKYVIIHCIRTFFGESNIEVQFRPSFFPFTEPSAEVDIKMQKNDTWLEVLGCGMIHPKVLHNVGLDSDQYQGFAFGLGVERFAMLKYQIHDLRQFFEGDVRWLDHYGFMPFDIPTLMNRLRK
jgi:phenylalanyl-tRNA synthetase alpha chain